VLKDKVIEALKKVLDPEIMLDVYTLGLIYKVEEKNGEVRVLMTLTTPLCPYGDQLVKDVKKAVEGVKGVRKAKVELTFTPRWEPSEELRALLGV